MQALEQDGLEAGCEVDAGGGGDKVLGDRKARRGDAAADQQRRDACTTAQVSIHCLGTAADYAKQAEVIAIPKCTM